MWCYGLMAKVNVIFVVDKWYSYQNSPWGKFQEMSLPSWSWVATLVMVGQEGLSKGDHLTRGTLTRSIRFLLLLDGQSDRHF